MAVFAGRGKKKSERKMMRKSMMFKFKMRNSGKELKKGKVGLG